MRKVYMQRRNDCLTACLATVLSVDYETVPYLFDDNDQTLPDWEGLVQRFLARHWLQMLTVNVDEGLLNTFSGLLIVSGLSLNPEYRKKGVHHAVIYKNGKLWHEPDPNAKGEIEPLLALLLVSIKEV